MSEKRVGFPVVAVIPSLNPDEKLTYVVDGLLAAGFSDVLIVNDGSREACQEIFAEISKRPGCVVICHDVNKGKGCALKTAFSYYLEHYDQEHYFGVVTADSDGQHLAKDIMSAAEAIISSEEKSLRANSNTLVLGTRDFDDEQVPFKSRNGNKITSVVFRILYGKSIKDTQTGLRAITKNSDFNGFCYRSALGNYAGCFPFKTAGGHIAVLC